MSKAGTQPLYGQVRGRTAAGLARNERLSLDARLVLLAMGSANSAGHAHFGAGVVSVLERVDKRSGELTTYDE